MHIWASIKFTAPVVSLTPPTHTLPTPCRPQLVFLCLTTSAPLCWITLNRQPPQTLESTSRGTTRRKTLALVLTFSCPPVAAFTKQVNPSVFNWHNSFQLSLSVVLSGIIRHRMQRLYKYSVIFWKSILWVPVFDIGMFMWPRYRNRAQMLFSLR